MTELEKIIKTVREETALRFPELYLDDKGKKTLEAHIRRVVTSGNLTADGIGGDALVKRLMQELAGYSVLSGWLEREDIEEINVNGYDDIQIIYTDGRREKAAETFFSPAHACDVVRKLLSHSGMTLDMSTPAAQGHLPGGRRVAAVKNPVVDADRGVAASIRILHPGTVDAETLVTGGTLTGTMLSFLNECISCGVSLCVAGRTGAGKTTLLNALLSSVQDNRRIYTIESGAREMDLIRRRGGVICNNVVHTLARPSERRGSDITQEKLLETALRFDPDVICVGEMRDSEADAAVEAAETDHTVVTTVHGQGGRAAHLRIAMLTEKKYPMDMRTALFRAASAFPVIVYERRLADGSRRVTEITECAPDTEGIPVYRTLWRYRIESSVRYGKTTKVCGAFERPDPLSRELCARLVRGGMDTETLEKLTDRENV